MKITITVQKIEDIEMEVDDKFLPLDNDEDEISDEEYTRLLIGLCDIIADKIDGEMLAITGKYLIAEY